MTKPCKHGHTDKYANGRCRTCEVARRAERKAAGHVPVDRDALYLDSDPDSAAQVARERRAALAAVDAYIARVAPELLAVPVLRRWGTAR